MSIINETEILKFMCESPLKELGHKVYAINPPPDAYKDEVSKFEFTMGTRF